MYNIFAYQRKADESHEVKGSPLEMAELEAVQAQMQGTIDGLVAQVTDLRALYLESNSKQKDALDQKVNQLLLFFRK